MLMLQLKCLCYGMQFKYGFDLTFRHIYDVRWAIVYSLIDSKEACNEIYFATVLQCVMVVRSVRLTRIHFFQLSSSFPSHSTFS